MATILPRATGILDGHTQRRRGAPVPLLGTVLAGRIAAARGPFAVAFVGTPRMMAQNRLSDQEPRGSGAGFTLMDPGTT
jgi:hypothetical protein